MNKVLAEAEMQRRSRNQGSTTMVLQPPPPAAVTPNTTTSPPAPPKKGRKIKASMMAGAQGVHFTGGTFMNVGGSLIRHGAKVDGVNFHDAIEGEEEDEIEVDFAENASDLRLEGTTKLDNVGGAVRYLSTGQDGVAKSSRVQKGHVHAHMFTGIKGSVFTGGEYTNVAGNIDYVGVVGSAPLSEVKTAPYTREDELETGDIPGGWR